jgi:hypothetical protein
MRKMKRPPVEKIKVRQKKIIDVYLHYLPILEQEAKRQERSVKSLLERIIADYCRTIKNQENEQPRN